MTIHTDDEFIIKGDVDLAHLIERIFDQMHDAVYTVPKILSLREQKNKQNSDDKQKPDSNMIINIVER